MKRLDVFGRQKYEVRLESPGRLSYREGNHEYVFPVYEEDGKVIIAGFPSRYCLYLFLGWYRVPKKFTTVAGHRIFPRLLQHFRHVGQEACIFERANDDDRAFVFYPELFAQRARASEVLDEAGFTCFGDYSSIDLLHEEYGLEIRGIREASDAALMAGAMQAAFPHWHYSSICHSPYGREPGWELGIHMFPCCGDSRHVDTESD